MGRPRAWQPILTGCEASEALTVAKQIGEACSEWTQATERWDLAEGLAGVALHQAYLSKCLGTERWAAEALTSLERAAELAGGGRLGLFSGWTGVGWSVAHLGSRVFSVDTDVSLGELDALLLTHLRQSPWLGQYDLISGLVGYGVYALERNEEPWTTKCLELITRRVDELAIPSENGVAWFTDAGLLPSHQRLQYPRGYYNLGLAHGAPGLIALLAAAAGRGSEPDRARHLVSEGIRWCRSHEMTGESPSLYAGMTSETAQGMAARAAWCYGDPGVGIAFLNAAVALKDVALRQSALRILHHAALRPVNTSGVKDAGICHGAAGLAHIFNRAYHITGEQLFERAARAWIRRTLDMRDRSAGVGGYSTWAPIELTGLAEQNPTFGWIDCYGFLGGAAGIGLALLAAASCVEPQWDTVLLIGPTTGCRQPARSTQRACGNTR